MSQERETNFPNENQVGFMCSVFASASITQIATVGLGDREKALEMAVRHEGWIMAAENAMLESGETDLDKLRSISLVAMHKSTNSP